MNKQPSPLVSRRLAWVVGIAAAGVLAASAGAAVVQTWQRFAVSDPDSGATAPTAFVDAAGNVTALWLQRQGSIDRLAVAVRPTASKRWPNPDAPTFVSKSGENADGFAAAVNAKGDAVVVWNAGTIVKESHRYGSGGAWSAPVPLRAATGAVGSLAVSLNDKRDAVIAWREGTAVRTTYRRGVAPFVASAKINDVATTRVDHVFTGIDRAGNGHVAWDQLQTGAGGNRLGVYLAKRPAGSSTWVRSARTAHNYDTRVTSLAVRESGAALMGTQRGTGASAKAVVVPYVTGGSSVTPGTAKTFGGAGTATSNPIVALNSRGDAVVAYLSTGNQSYWELRLASYRDATSTWLAPETVSGGGMQTGLGVAISYTGIGGAIWTEAGARRTVRAALRRSFSLPWEAPVTVDQQAGDADSTSLFERGGHFIAAWTNWPASKQVANVGVFDTVKPKVRAGFPKVLPVRTSIAMAIDAQDQVSTIDRYDWTFWDDSPPATGRVVKHYFKRTGDYRVTLKAIDAAGNFARTQVIVRVVNYAAVRGFPVIGGSVTCKTSIPGARFVWRRNGAELGGGARHQVVAADLGKRLSCIAYTTKQTATSAPRRIPRVCKVPRVVGMPVAEAKSAVRARGCRVSVTTVKTGPARAGKVISSTPAAGAGGPNGLMVRLRAGASLIATSRRVQQRWRGVTVNITASSTPPRTRVFWS